MLCPRWLFSTRAATTARALCVFPIDLILTISHLFQRAFCWLLQYNKPMSKALLVNRGPRIPNPKLPPRLLPVALLSEDRRWQKHRFPPHVAISLQSRVGISGNPDPGIPGFLLVLPIPSPGLFLLKSRVFRKADARRFCFMFTLFWF